MRTIFVSVTSQGTVPNKGMLIIVYLGVCEMPNHNDYLHLTRLGCMLRKMSDPREYLLMKAQVGR